MTERQVEHPEKDLPLREDVSTLGALVGDVIREQGGEELFAIVESARLAAIRRRETGEGESELEKILESPAPELAERLALGFSTYFQVVNLAETMHRIRRRRDYLSEGERPQPNGLEDVLGRLKRAGVGLDQVRSFLEALEIEPVFTAHPTEATRRAILEKHQAIAVRLRERLDPSRTPREERVALERIRAEVTSGWQTEEYPPVRPQVADELDHVLFYVTDVIYRIVPAFYEAFEEALLEVFGAGAREVEVPSFLRFASWVGGDMDGNPNVTAETVRTTLEEHRRRILGRYRREIGALSRHLTQSGSRVSFDPQVEALIGRYSRLLPEVAAAIPAQHRDMHYLVLLRLILGRLERTGADSEGGYGGVGELEGDLRTIATSLENHRGTRAGLFSVRRLQRRVETFGFHLATLDVRQDSEVHRRVVGELLGDDAWAGRSVAERAERLRRELAAGSAPISSERSSPGRAEASATLEVFRALAEAQGQYGLRATGLYIISMARDVDDVLSVLLLARWAGLVREVDGEQVVPLDVAPLFETVGDLEGGAATMERLLTDPVYRRHLETRGGRQVVMVGYSDSNKDGGLAPSRWALRKAQTALVATHQAHDVALTIFHGRGGTVSRGGGKTRGAVLAAPRGAVAGRLRLTEQGEVINAKYGLRGTAMRNLELATGAVAQATIGADPEDPREAEWGEVMEQVADASRSAYTDLVYGDPDFLEYFRRATPIDVIERMVIGSRPPSRRSKVGIEGLRAIPWVFAWTQSRHVLPGWYGLGSGLEHAVRQHGLEPMRDMARDWRFFGALLGDVEMVLAKADLVIAQRYAELAGDVGTSIFARICAEHQLTESLILDLLETDSLLANDPMLKRSIRLRNPYVDPMSLLQIDLLRRWRATDRQDPALLRALLATVHGIAQGLQNTG